MLALVGCDSSSPTDSGVADVPDGTFCAEDGASLTVCERGACRAQACRGDELCQGAACVPWTEADLFADFTLERSTTVTRGIIVRVSPGGFPRAQVDSLRFSFGDGTAGYGELLRHAYAEPGVYPVELEVRLTGYRVLRASRLAVIDPPTDHSPVFLTTNDIPDYLNGSIPLTRNGGTPDDPSDDVREPFMLQIPREGFELDVVLLDDPADPVDRGSLSLVADAAMGTAPAGTELADRLRFDEDDTLRVAHGRWIVGSDEAAPEGIVTFTLSGRTASGQTYTSSLALEAVTLTADRDPFDRPLTWLFRHDSDFFSTRADDTSGQRALVSASGPNGAPDLIEELALLGAQGEDLDLNARYLELIEDAIAREVYRYYGMGPDGTPHDGIQFRIVWQGRGGAPDPAAFRADGEFSMMRFGGFFDGYLGFSGFAPYDEARVDDSTAEHGVATATILGTLSTTPIIADAIAPLWRAPLGSDARDREVLDPAFDPYAPHDDATSARYALLRDFADYVALAISAVTAHEMGHAMGLMPNSVPPDGYFGGVLDVTFVSPAHTDSHHADLPGLNLMQAGGGLTQVLDDALASLELPRGFDILELARIFALENRLSAYSRAYMQRQLTYASFDAAASGYRVGCK